MWWGDAVAKRGGMYYFFLIVVGVCFVKVNLGWFVDSYVLVWWDVRKRCVGVSEAKCEVQRSTKPIGAPRNVATPPI
jgi:hypothetical protein